MDAYVITLRGNEYSERVARRCIKSANIPVRVFGATPAHEARWAMECNGLEWTWGREPWQHSYGGNTEARIGCAMSHYRLWRKCAETGPTLILEHDAVFIKDFEPFPFKSACMINDPRGATPKGGWWSAQMSRRGPGIWPKTAIFEGKRPDGLAGGSAYLLQPETAEKLVEIVHRDGLWPNDATLCLWNVPDLEECYPFITEVRPERSTINP